MGLRRKTGKCLGLGGCCLKRILNYKGSAMNSAVLRCVQNFSSGIVVNTKMFTKKSSRALTCFCFQKELSVKFLPLQTGIIFFFNTGLVNMILEEIPEP